MSQHGMSAVQLVWFKRDLRIHDHAPLVMAAQAGAVLPLYILEPKLWQQPDAAPRQWRFIRQSLRELDAALRDLGARRLLLRVGDAVTVLRQLQQECGYAALYSHEETGNQWTFDRDRAVGKFLQAQGIVWHEFRQDGVVRRLNHRYGWAAHWQNLVAAQPWSPPRSLPALDLKSDPLPEESALFDETDPCPGAQPGGRLAGLALLNSFLLERGREYAAKMSSPRTAAEHCSRLSPHLAYGTVSLREVVQALSARQAEAPSGWSRSLKAFRARLAWQSHFMQKLESEPELEFRNLHPALRTERQQTNLPLLSAFYEAKTGFPFVDACLTALKDTGWINFRMRAMLAAFACYHLWQPWQVVGGFLARRFIDYEPGIHWSQMQMQSGSTGINAFRIYNPIKQSHDQDPDGEFIRRWLPALRAVPNEWIHEPWRMPSELQARYHCVIGQDYPAPIIEHESAARAAKARLKAAYANETAKAQSLAVFEKHGSRKKRAARHPNAPKSSPVVASQLGLFDEP